MATAAEAPTTYEIHLRCSWAGEPDGYIELSDAAASAVFTLDWNEGLGKMIQEGQRYKVTITRADEEDGDGR